MVIRQKLQAALVFLQILLSTKVLSQKRLLGATETAVILNNSDFLPTSVSGKKAIRSLFLEGSEEVSCEELNLLGNENQCAVNANTDTTVYLTEDEVQNDDLLMEENPNNSVSDSGMLTPSSLEELKCVESFTDAERGFDEEFRIQEIKENSAALAKPPHGQGKMMRKPSTPLRGVSIRKMATFGILSPRKTPHEAKEKGNKKIPSEKKSPPA